MSLSLSDLIAHIGAENIEVQPMDLAAVSAKTIRGGTELTIVTRAWNPSDLLLLSQGGKPEKVGLILWMPRDKAERAKTAHANKPEEIP